MVWVGFDDNRELNLEGARSALPIWAEFMKRAASPRPIVRLMSSVRPPVWFRLVSAMRVETRWVQLPESSHRGFINGTEPTSTCESHGVPADIGAVAADAADSIW